MKCLFVWAVLVWACVGPFVLGDEAKDAKEDSKKMQGTWKPVVAEIGGKPYPEEILKTMKLVVTDNKYTVTVGEAIDEGTVKLDPTKHPRAMDIAGTKGPNQGKTIPAIYELTDTTLRICYDLSGKARPKEFK
ncbi:MAG TPA: TIGR03067 domain-containing protein, partial [Gemmataceae bacterium]|nr:TIGR03067 domain-containing protein [Gemmataceae bacterium]